MIDLWNNAHHFHNYIQLELFLTLFLWSIRFARAMFKKTSHIVISLLLLISTMGFTISAHYCGENLKTISVVNDPDSCCDIPDGCCHDETDTFRIDDDYSSSTFNFESKLIVSLLLDYSIPFTEELSAKNFPISNFIEPPPPTIKQVLSRIQVYIL